MRVLRRNSSRSDVIEPWVARLGGRRPARGRRTTTATRTSTGGNAEAFLRALYLQLALGAASRPRCRSDLLLVVVDALRATNPQLPPGRTDRRVTALPAMT